MNWFFIYLFLWCAAAACSGIAVRFCIWLAPKWGFLDLPLHEAHKRHRTPMPVMGGLGMYLGWLTILVTGLLLCRYGKTHLPQQLQDLLPGLSTVFGKLHLVILGAGAAVILGMWDDRRPLHALPKFGGQFIIALLLVLQGFKISFLHAIPCANEALSVLWILTVMNALNFFDNMDGLAAGACAIAAFVFLCTAGIRGQYFVATLAAITGGAASGFLIYNLSPAKIFMGDGGSHFLGILLALCGILTTFYVPGENPTPMPLLIPLCALGVPLFDVCAVILIRWRLHVPIYIGDNRHISHRFVKIGLSRPRAVLAVHLLCLIIALAGLSLLWLPPAGAILVALLILSVFLLISLLQFYLQEALHDDK